MSSARFLWSHKPCVLLISERGVTVCEASSDELAAHYAALGESAAPAAAPAPCVDAPVVVASGQALLLEEAEREPEPELEPEPEPEPEPALAPAEPKAKRSYSKCTHGHPCKKNCPVCSQQKRAPRKKPAAAASAPAE